MPTEDYAHWNETIPRQPMDRDQAIYHFIDKGGPWAGRDKLVAGLDRMIVELMEGSEPGDELWLCGSRKMGVLAGHEGLGVVRGGQMLRYTNILSR